MEDEILLSSGAALAARIERLIARSNVSMRQFSLLCGLPPNSINVTLSRLKRSTTLERGPSMTVALLEKIARQARCSFKWLALGIGDMDAPDEPFVNMRRD